MQSAYAHRLTSGKPASGAMSARLRARVWEFVPSLLGTLDRHLEARLVRTFAATVEAPLWIRHRNYDFPLSELSGYLADTEHAPAGTKRLSNLLRSAKWAYLLIARFLWDAAATHVQRLTKAGEEVLLIWDESVLEKPESRTAEGLGAVRSSKAARLKRIKPGFYHPPGGPPVFVPGLQWLCLLVAGYGGPPTVAAMQWWTNRASGRVTPEDPRDLRRSLLARCVKAWGRQVLHVCDRGYAGEPWLRELLQRRCRFVLRWPKRWKLQATTGDKQPAWQFTRGLRSWETQYLTDRRRGEAFPVGIVAVCLQHPSFVHNPLWLVVVRSRTRKGQREPWYLLTNEPIESADDAWRVMGAYARRWQIEMTFRYTKSELALESPRLWSWERRLKLLLMVTLVYAFLLSLLQAELQLLRRWLLRYFCHRTGKRGRETPAPLYRLRAALGRLWLAYPATPT